MSNAPFLHKLDELGHEIVFAPFHDPILSSKIPATATPYPGTQLEIEYGWCWTSLIWNSVGPDGKVALFELDEALPVSPYSHMVLCLSAPKTVYIQVWGNLENGRTLLGTMQGEGERTELIIPLTYCNKTCELTQLALEITSSSSYSDRIDISWFGLRNDAACQSSRADSLQRKSSDWSSFIVPTEEWGEIQFAKGLLFSETDLVALRKKVTLPGWKEHFAILCQHADSYLKRVPEEDIGRVLPTDDQRYIRENERGKTPYYWEALTLAFVGLVKNDKKYLLHALRYLCSTLDSAAWVQSAEHIIPTSTWDTRAFAAEMTTTSMALLWDWLDFTLTPSTRALLHQALWDRGVSPVMRDLMRYPYMARMNQGAVFSRACILGGLMLEDTWDMPNFVDERYAFMEDVLKGYIKDDGFCHEGLVYLCQTIQGVLFPIIAYNRSRGKNWKKEAKSLFKRCLNYLEAISCDIPGTGIPTGDSRSCWFSGDAVPILASFSPRSSMNNVLYDCLINGKIYASSGTLTKSGGILGLVYGPENVTKSTSIRPSKRHMKYGGILTVRREFQDSKIGLFFAGSGISEGHGHPDAGQFVIDIDGVPILVDPGILEYNLVASSKLRESFCHNVLTPIGADGSYPSQLFLESPINVTSKLFSRHVDASLLLTSVWKDFFKNYKRRIISKRPDKYTIVDSGTAFTEQQVAFHLQLPSPVNIEEDKIIYHLERFEVEISAPWASAIHRREEYKDCSSRNITHIAVHSLPGKEFCLTTNITISRRSDVPHS